MSERLGEYRKRIYKRAEPYLQELNQRLDKDEDPLSALLRVWERVRREASSDIQHRALYNEPDDELLALYECLRAHLEQRIGAAPTPIRLSVEVARILLGALEAANHRAHERVIEQSRPGLRVYPEEFRRLESIKTAYHHAGHMLQAELQRVKAAAARHITPADIAALDDFDARLAHSSVRHPSAFTVTDDPDTS